MLRHSYDHCVIDDTMGEVKFRQDFSLRQKSKTQVWSKTEVQTEFDLMTTIWSKTKPKTKVWSSLWF